jgi:hypothetical protein
MPSTTVAGAKICCKCGRDVAGKKRLKDHSGRYWCADCGNSDEKRKRLIEGGICAHCGEAFHGHELTVIGDSTFCKRCLKHRARKETHNFGAAVKDMLTGSRDYERRTVLLMLAGSAVLIGLAVWRWVL